MYWKFKSCENVLKSICVKTRISAFPSAIVYLFSLVRPEVLDVVSSDMYQMILVGVFQSSSADPHPPPRFDWTPGLLPQELFIFAETSPRWGYWEHIRNREKKHSYLLSAPTLAHHTLRSMQTALTRTCRKTQVNRQKHTLADAHSRSLRSVGSQKESQSVRLFFPPTSFLPGSHVCLALPSVLHAVEQTCLWLQDFHKVESMSSGVLQKWKTRAKVSRSESGFGFNSHLGPLSCLVTHVLILKSVI